MYHRRASIKKRHPPHNWEFVNTAARLAELVVTEDIGKTAWQLDDDSSWRLKSVSPNVWVRTGGAGSTQGVETLAYTDIVNKVIGPLAENTTDVFDLNMFVILGILQDYGPDYTVREVTGGSAPGFYICISTASTAPGGGSFGGGSNPGTGIDSVLTIGDKVRVTYPV